MSIPGPILFVIINPSHPGSQHIARTGQEDTMSSKNTPPMTLDQAMALATDIQNDLNIPDRARQRALWLAEGRADIILEMRADHRTDLLMEHSDEGMSSFALQYETVEDREGRLAEIREMVEAALEEERPQLVEELVKDLLDECATQIMEEIIADDDA